MPNFSNPLVILTDKGLYCPKGDFYIDPHRAVEHAVITHAHSDHARRGSQKYYCAMSSLSLLRSRLGGKIQAVGVPFGESFSLGAVQLSFYPAGHILGSAQIRIHDGSEVWVVSGDYKREPDPSCEPFEPVRCDTFITEATFGTPRFAWPQNLDHGKAIFAWWSKNAEQGKNSVLFAYSLGKAQRVLAELAPYTKRPLLIHKSIVELTECYRSEGRELAPTVPLEEVLSKQSLCGELLLAPPSILKGEWLSRLGDLATAFASGWAHGQSEGGIRYGYGANYDKGFVMSDHADWQALNHTIDETGAKRVFVMHRNGALVRHLCKRGIDAHHISALVPNFQKSWDF